MSPDSWQFWGIVAGQLGALLVVLVQSRKRKNEAADLKARVAPVSNGFASEMRATLAAVVAGVERIESRLDTHLEHHGDTSPHRRKKAA